MHSAEINNASILATANEISRVAGETALSFFRNKLDIDLKSDESPVTAADLKIERQARDIIEKNFPNHEILGEEFGVGDLTKEDIWVIDPIDGTRSFISGHPLFGFLLAYVKNGQSQIGIVSMPALGERFVGQKGKGATLNSLEIRSSTKTRLADAILFINEGEKLFANEPGVHARLVEAGHTRRFGYDCYPHALLAAGHVDAVVDYDLKPFDFMPLVGLIEAAGGIMTDWDGNSLDFQSAGKVVSAATPELHGELLDLISGGQKGDFDKLLAPEDGSPFDLINAEGQSPIVLVCEHASNRIPVRLGDLGLTGDQKTSHVAWDPGARELAMALSTSLDAPLIAARFSRLVYDCNRPPDVESAMPATTEAGAIPGNQAISIAAHGVRTSEIYEPFQSEVSRVLESKRREGFSPILITVHSFTPVFQGKKRLVEVGYLHGEDRRLADAMLANTQSDIVSDIRLNQPYGPDDGVLHTIDRHIDTSNTPHVMIEVRNDLLAVDISAQHIHVLLREAIEKSLIDLQAQSNIQETGTV